VSDVFLVSSGTAALALTLAALRSRSTRTEVVLPAYTCPSVPAAVLHAGLRPRLCDVDPHTFDFDGGQLERALNANTLCVIAHHLFGIGSDIARTRAMCEPRGIVVVEDAAQAMGTEWDGRKLGTLGDVGIFSLGRGKTITCGSGGMIVTRSTPIAAAIDGQYRRLPRPTGVETLKDLARLLVLTAFIRPCLYWIPAALPWLKLGETIYPAAIPIARLSGIKAGLLRNWRRRLADSSRGGRVLQPAAPPSAAGRAVIPVPAAAHPGGDEGAESAAVRVVAGERPGLQRGLSTGALRRTGASRPVQRRTVSGSPPTGRHAAHPAHASVALEDRQAGDCGVCASRSHKEAQRRRGHIERREPRFARYRKSETPFTSRV
jgi:perosamine synthetase